MSSTPWVKRWWAVAVMMIVTIVFGTDLFSSENTRPVIRWIMQWFLGERAWDQLGGSSEGWLRKSAHFIEYAILAYLWFRALRRDNEQRWNWKWFAIALGVTIVWASVDELQQGFISRHRTGSAWDVLLDTSGGLTALMLIYVIFLTKRIRQVRTPTTEPEANAPSSSAHQ